MPLKIHTTWNGRLYVEDEDLYESSEVTDKIRKLGNLNQGIGEIPSIATFKKEFAGASNDEEKNRVLKEFVGEEDE